jgi:hypothetical protein
MLCLGDKRTIGLLLCTFFGVSLALVSSGIAPAFTEDIARSVNVSIFNAKFCCVHLAEFTSKLFYDQGC